MWEIGDWLIVGEDEVFRHLNRVKVRELARSITGYSRHTLTMAASVARKIRPSMRIDGLTWWHHLVVARLGGGEAEQNDWLVRAAEGDWSVKVLRQQLHEPINLRRPLSSSGKVIDSLTKLKREDISEPRRVELREWFQREFGLEHISGQTAADEAE